MGNGGTLVEILFFFIAYLAGIATWAFIGYLVSRNDPNPQTMTQEEIVEAVQKALK